MQGVVQDCQYPVFYLVIRQGKSILQRFIQCRIKIFNVSLLGSSTPRRCRRCARGLADAVPCFNANTRFSALNNEGGDAVSSALLAAFFILP
jgi:hypothetical protein